MEPTGEGWAVTLGDGATRQYDAVIVANGHHNDPVWPSFPGAFDGDHVVFTDGSSEPVDAIVYCTGYRTTFPFLHPAIFAAAENRVRLYQQIFHPKWPGLCFVGLFQAVAWGFLPLYEAQGRLVAAYLAGRYALPEPAAMEQAIAQAMESNARRFLNSPRSNYMLNGPLYLADCRVELARGRRRSADSTYRQTPHDTR